MKKYTAVFAAALLTVLCTVSSYAAEAPFRTAGDLYAYWMENSACPDYITGVWSSDGGYENLTIGVQNTEDGRRGMEEIRAAVLEDDTVTFVYQQYSRNYLNRVQEELLPWFEADCGLVFSGVYETDNRLHLGIRTERQGDPATEAMLTQLREKYGDIFTVEYTEAVYTLTQTLQPTVTETSAFPWILTAAILLSLTAGLRITLRRRNARLLQTTAGCTVSAPLTRLDTEDAVKASPIPTPPSLDERILAAVEKAE